MKIEFIERSLATVGIFPITFGIPVGHGLTAGGKVDFYTQGPAGSKQLPAEFIEFLNSLKQVDTVHWFKFRLTPVKYFEKRVSSKKRYIQDHVQKESKIQDQFGRGYDSPESLENHLAKEWSQLWQFDYDSDDPSIILVDRLEKSYSRGYATQEAGHKITRRLLFDRKKAYRARLSSRGVGPLDKYGVMGNGIIVSDFTLSSEEYKFLRRLPVNYGLRFELVD